MRYFATVFVLIVASLTNAWAHADSIAFGHTDIRVGDTPMWVEIATTPQQMIRGLMRRTTVAPYDGMVFVFADPQPVTFWMKDTPMALEVGFFDPSGTLVEIHPMKPNDTTDIPSLCQQVKYALELPFGGFATKGIKIGDKMTFPRGFSPSD